MQASMKLLTCGRLAVRAVITSSGGMATKHNSSFQQRKLLPQIETTRSTLASTATIAASAPHSIDESTSCSTPPTPSTRNRVLTACCGFPKDMLFGPSKVLDHGTYGDDSCFIASHHSADVVGVADGVGGWRKYGIDPSNFSRSLMRTCADLVESGNFRPNRPVQLLACAYRKLDQNRAEQLENDSNDDRLVGSSTACIVSFDRSTSHVYTANLGDSGFVVVRDGRVLMQSKEQTHYFNAPFQLLLSPNFDGDFLGDSPYLADNCHFEARDGDVILVATDGLFDNLPTEMIEKEIGELFKDGGCMIDERRLQHVCNSLALQARRLALDEQYMSPFALKASEQGIDTCGGKVDDITLVLLLISSFDSSSAELSRH